MEKSLIPKVFSEVQRNSFMNDLFRDQLLEYYERVGLEVFSDEFAKTISVTQYLIGEEIGNPFYEKIKSFVLNFIDFYEGVERNELNTFVCLLLSHIIKFHDVKKDWMRFRVCELIAEIFKTEMPYLETISLEVMDELKEAMLERIKDTKLNTRLEAVKVLDFLQEPQNPTDPVISGLMHHITQSHAKIRCAIVSIILPIPDVIPCLILRCRDTDEKVRIAAFEKFTTISPKVLSIIQRQSVLNDAFTNESEEIRKCIKEKLLPAWLKKYNNNYYDLITSVYLDATDEDVKQTIELTKMMLYSLFSTQPILDILSPIHLNEKVIPISDISWETAIYWKCLGTYFRNDIEKEKYLEELLPETTNYCKYLLHYFHSFDLEKMTSWDVNQFQMILLQLVSIAVDCDISDECSRKCLMKTFLTLLKEDISKEVIKKIFEYINRMVTNKERRISMIFEIISDIRHPFEPNLSIIEDENQIRELKSSVSNLSEDQRKAIEIQDFEKAESLKLDISSLSDKLKELQVAVENKLQGSETVQKTDPKTLLKCTNIISELMQSIINTPNDQIKMCRSELLQDMYLINTPEMQAKVMENFTMCSLFDKETARECVLLFGSALLAYQEDKVTFNEMKMCVAIKTVVDVIIMYGHSIFLDEKIEDENSNESGDENQFNQVSFRDVIHVLILMLDDELPIIQETSGLGLMKILSMNRLHLPMLVSKLILKLFNPCTKELPILYSHLSNFLLNFSNVPNAIEQIEEALIPTLEKVGHVSRLSPLINIPVDKLIKFLAHITKYASTPNHDIHKNLAEKILVEMGKDVRDLRYNTILVRTLLLLDLSYAGEEFIEEADEECCDLLSAFEMFGKAKQIIKYLEKFQAYLKLIDTNTPHKSQKNN